MSALASYQRSVLRLAFDAEPREQDLHALGDRERALVYRHMIRTRLLNMAKVAFRRSLEVLGTEAFEASFARFLQSAPPRSRFIRDAVVSYGPFARADTLLLAAGPAFAADLLRFEETKWRIAYVPAAGPRAEEGGVRELDFEGAPVLNPALEVLSLGHAVHELTDRTCREGALCLLVYRPPQIDEVRWYAPEPFFGAVLCEAQRSPGRSLAELVRATLDAQGVTPDQDLLERLATSVTRAVERGVLLGSRDTA